MSLECFNEQETPERPDSVDFVLPATLIGGQPWWKFDTREKMLAFSREDLLDLLVQVAERGDPGLRAFLRMALRSL